MKVCGVVGKTLAPCQGFAGRSWAGSARSGPIYNISGSYFAAAVTVNQRGEKIPKRRLRLPIEVTPGGFLPPCATAMATLASS